MAYLAESGADFELDVREFPRRNFAIQLQTESRSRDVHHAAGNRQPLPRQVKLRFQIYRDAGFGAKGVVFAVRHEQAQMKSPGVLRQTVNNLRRDMPVQERHFDATLGVECNRPLNQQKARTYTANLGSNLVAYLVEGP